MASSFWLLADGCQLVVVQLMLTQQQPQLNTLEWRVSGVVLYNQLQRVAVQTAGIKPFLAPFVVPTTLHIRLQESL